MATSDLDEFIEHYHLALNEFFSGNPQRRCTPTGKTPALPIRSAPLRLDGSKLPRPWNVRHRITERARPRASKERPSTSRRIWPISSK